jgi:AcrR family transcriptional regulator
VTPPASRREHAAHPVRQARGQETLERLLAAAEAVLEEGGLDAATVPAIAERAGVSVGNVYKRFPDKDALLRAVYVRFFVRTVEQNRAALDPARWQGVAVHAIIRALVSGMVRGYVLHRALLRALLLYAETHEDAEFRRRAEAMRTEAFRAIARLLLARGEEIGHAEPAEAIEFALFVVGLALRGMLLPERRQLLYAGSADRFAEELTAMVVAYLGVKERGKNR